MNNQERSIILSFFSKYYETAPIDIPNIENREFGIGINKKIDIRHLSFSSNQQFKGYLAQNTPFYVSHSVSQYLFPEATPIERKNWQGGDLVFDLDLHAEGKYEAYPKLGEIKQDTIRLMEDFIVADFGIKKEEIKFVFSGNRGYHIHVRNKDLFDLRGEQKREILDYVKGTGLDYTKFLDLERKKGGERILGPKPTENGYRGRFARAVISLLNTNPKNIDRKFAKNVDEKNNFLKGIEEGNWSKTSVKDMIAKLKVVADKLPLYTVDADAAVSYDLSKLIRVPNSIHGSTGFIAKTVQLADIEKFDPMKDALIKGDKQMKIKFIEDIPKIEIAGETFEFKKDLEVELNESIAIFFVLKESASIAL